MGAAARSFRLSCAAFSTLVGAGLLGGCAPAASSALPTPSQLAIHVSLPPGKGAIVGGILRCYDLLPVGASVHFQAGAVAVYPVEDGIRQQVALRSDVVSSDSEYIFELPPGDYVLIPDDPATNLAAPTAEVHVASGRITTQNLQYGGCI